MLRVWYRRGERRFLRKFVEKRREKHRAELERALRHPETGMTASAVAWLYLSAWSLLLGQLMFRGGRT